MAKKYTGLNLAQTQPKDTIDFTGLGKGVLKAEEFKYKEKEAKKKEAMDFLKPEATFYPYQQSANKILSDAYEMMQKQDKIDPAEYQKIALEYNERIELGKAFGKEFASVVQGYYNDPEINADAAAKMLRDKYIVDGSIDELYRNSSTVLNGSEIYTQPGGSAALNTGVILSNRLKTIGEITTKLVTTGDYKKVPGLAGRAEAEVKTTLMKAASIVDLDANGVPYIKDIKSPLAQTAMDVMLTEDKVLRLVDDALLAKGVNQPTQDQRREELALKLALYASATKTEQQTSQVTSYDVPRPTSGSGSGSTVYTANWKSDITSQNPERIARAVDYIRIGRGFPLTALPKDIVTTVGKDTETSKPKETWAEWSKKKIGSLVGWNEQESEKDEVTLFDGDAKTVLLDKLDANSEVRDAEVLKGDPALGLDPNTVYVKLTVKADDALLTGNKWLRQITDIYIPQSAFDSESLPGALYKAAKNYVGTDYGVAPGTVTTKKVDAPSGGLTYALGGEIDVDTKYSDFKGTETVRDLIGGFSQGGYVSTSIYDLMKKGFADGGSMVVSELYELKTGKPWRTAREEGLTDGSYEQNIKLRQQLVRGDFNDNQTYSSGPIQEATVTAKAPDWLKFKKEFMKENPFDINQYVESRVNQPQTGRAAYERINEQEFRRNVREQGKKNYENKMYDYIQKKLVETNPQSGRPRGEWLDSFSEKEQKILKQNPRFQPTYITDFKRSLQSAFEMQPEQTFYNIANSPDFTLSEKRDIIMEHIENPIVSKLVDASGIFAPLSMGSKVIQSTYRDETTIEDALAGYKNDASIIEDLLTDITVFIGPGTAAKLKNLLKLGRTKDAAKVVAQVADKLPKEATDFIDDFVAVPKKVQGELKGGEPGELEMVPKWIQGELKEVNMANQMELFPRYLATDNEGILNYVTRYQDSAPRMSEIFENISSRLDPYLADQFLQYIQQGNTEEAAKIVYKLRDEIERANESILGATGKAEMKSMKKLDMVSPELSEPVIQTSSRKISTADKQEVPIEIKKGLHIKSTMSGSPLEKQVNKQGQIAVNNINNYIKKQDVPANDKEIIKRVLDSKFKDQNSINYNEFIDAIQDELADFELRPAVSSSFLDMTEKFVDNSYLYKPNFNNQWTPPKKPTGVKLKTGRRIVGDNDSVYTLEETLDMDAIISSFDDFLNSSKNWSQFSERIDDVLNSISNLRPAYDVDLPFTEISKTADYLDELKSYYNNIKRSYKKQKDYELGDMLFLPSGSSSKMPSSKFHFFENPFAHLRYFIKDNVFHAIEIQSDAMKSNYKIAGSGVESAGLKIKNYEPRVLQETAKIIPQKTIRIPADGETIARIELWDRQDPNWRRSDKFTPIIKRYTDYIPKYIKEAFGVEAKKVTDEAGNIWWEFDIPEDFRKKGQIKALGSMPLAPIIYSSKTKENEPNR